jgi:hypothetical protein
MWNLIFKLFGKKKQGLLILIWQTVGMRFHFLITQFNCNNL